MFSSLVNTPVVMGALSDIKLLYTSIKDVNIMTLKSRIKPEDRRKKLSELLKKKPLIRGIEAHNGISAIIGNDLKIELGQGSKTEILEFDVLWESSFTDSASKGLPDIEVVTPDSRIATIEQILQVTDKPIIVDGDTGGDPNNFEYFVSRLERLGVSAVIIEDKEFPKRNSLDPDARQVLEEPDVFAAKIRRGKDALLSDDFMIISRIESIIAGYGVDDALMRAKKYLLAGVDGVMIHSKDNTPDNILKFAEEYNKLCKELGSRKPLVCIPTTYNTITEGELQKYGVNIVIYANHLLRTSVKAMEEVCKTLLLNKRAFEADPYCAPVSKVFDMVGFTEIKQKDIESMVTRSRAKVIIPAAGFPKETIVKDLPTSMVEINGKTILRRQLDTLKRCDISDAVVIRGYVKEKFNIGQVKYFDVDDYQTGSLYSLFAARDEMEEGFIMIFSDILFDELIIENLLRSKEDITIVVDASYPYHRHEIDKELDLVIAKQKKDYYRELPSTIGKEISFVGKKIKKDIATHEFIGIAKFSPYGAQNLIQIYEDCKKNHRGRFHESESFERASIVDMLQEMIDRGFKIHYIETNKGWMEIHNKKDYEIAKEAIF